jgi:uncharacterized membrane protein
MSLFDIFLVLAIFSLVIWLVFIVFLIVVMYKTYQRIKDLEQSLQAKLNKNSKMLRAFPIATMVTPFVFSLFKKWRQK